MKHKATWELKNIIKALTIMEVLNTNEENNSTRRIRREENKRLNEAKLELKSLTRLRFTILCSYNK